MHPYSSFYCRSIHEALKALTHREFYYRWIHLAHESSWNQDIGDLFNSRLGDDFMPHFEGAVGAADGTHVPIHVTDARDSARFRSRKGTLSQNVLVVVNFNALFIYVLAGYDGSANDSTVYRKARENGLNLPQNQYFLADAGYPYERTLLIPLRGTTYHLREFRNYSDAARNRGM